MDRLDLYLIRHAPTISPKGIVPPADPDADLSDQTAFRQLAGNLPASAMWWVSPLKRCQMTAETLLQSGASAAQVTPDQRLTEQDYGDFHGRPVAEVWDEIKDGPKSNWHFLHPAFCPPGGESFLMLYDRTRAVLQSIEASATSDLVIVGHGMMFRTLIAHALDLPPEQALAFGISPLSLSRLTLIRTGASPDHGNGGRWSLTTLNQTFRSDM